MDLRPTNGLGQSVNQRDGEGGNINPRRRGTDRGRKLGLDESLKIWKTEEKH